MPDPDDAPLPEEETPDPDDDTFDERTFDDVEEGEE